MRKYYLNTDTTSTASVTDQMSDGTINEAVQDDFDWSLESDKYKRERAKYDAQIKVILYSLVDRPVGHSVSYDCRAGLVRVEVVLPLWPCWFNEDRRFEVHHRFRQRRTMLVGRRGRHMSCEDSDGVREFRGILVGIA